MTFVRNAFKYFILLSVSSACNDPDYIKQKTDQALDYPKSETQANDDEFKVFSEKFSDLQILRYQVPGFNELSLQQKKLAFYLSQAALAGRDIIWDQNYEHNLTIRRTLEEIVKHYSGDRDAEDFRKFLIYTKRVWFSNGIHHHYSNDKFIPAFSKEYFKSLVNDSLKANFPSKEDESNSELANRLIPIMFDPAIAAKKVNLDPSVDIVKESAVNFYSNVSREEIDAYYNSLNDPSDRTPPSYGLNSKLIKNSDGELVEQVYKVGGLYGSAIEKNVYWLKKASAVAESQGQKKSLDHLISYYETGDLRQFDLYNIEWVKDTSPIVDTNNGFIEVYNDPLGRKGSYEGIVSIKDLQTSKELSSLSQEAQWFEDHSPIADRFKRERVTGVSYKVINVVTESGDASPSTPIGINLPNSNWIRSTHGSKSVSLGNIEHAYAESEKSDDLLNEFYLPEQIPLIKKYGSIVNRLTTGLHEVIGHASGKILPGVGKPSDTLKSYASTLEEARADLVALYYIGDDYLVEKGLTPSTEVMKAEYIQYINNGLARQLVRIKEGDQIEESHMKNRQLIAAWAFERGKEKQVIEKVTINNKTYFKINDYQKLRNYFGELLAKIQEIKSLGNYEEGKHLVETYGVKVDLELHREILARWKPYNKAAYSGFINPKLSPQYDNNNDIVNVSISYPTDFSNQMLEYARDHSFL